MKRSFWLLVGLLVVVTGAWLAADTFLPQPLTYFSFRGTFVLLTGCLAISLFSLAMILATRLQFIENFIGGLDKVYRLHKWVGVAALIAAVTHWWWAQGTKWMVGWGWLERPVRGARGAIDTSTLEGFLQSQRGNAETLVTLVIYFVFVLLILALVKRFRYSWFQKTHKFLALFYLAIAVHGVVLMKFAYWSQPIGWLVGALILAGTVSAVMILAGCVGKSKKAKAEVVAVENDADAQTLTLTVAADARWQGHEAGQFAFLTIPPSSEAHPFTIASAWDAKTRKITFVIKELGDYTRRLPSRVAVGDTVTIEGGYGHFTFADDKKRQIWIGAGIGVTPFLARLQALNMDGADRSKNVDFFYPTQVCSDASRDKLAQDCANANAGFHLLISPRDGFLSAADIMKAVPDWKNASIWFCGPVAFGKALKRDFANAGMDADAWHQELFHMR